MTHLALLIFALSALFKHAASADVGNDPLAKYFKTVGLDISPLNQLAPMTTKLSQNPLLNEYNRETKYIITEEIKAAFDRFMDHKKEHGTTFEKEHYAEKSGDDLIRKCMEKKAIAFYGDDDKTILREGGITFFPPWEYIGNETWEKGTTEQKEQMLMDHLTYNPYIDNYEKWMKGMPGGYDLYKGYLFNNFNIDKYHSYDEMELCVLLSIGGPTTFYNDGARNNEGKVAPSREITEKGFIVEAVGPRFSKNCYNDHLLYVQQNVYAFIAKQAEMIRIMFNESPSGQQTEQWADERGKPPYPMVNVFVDLLRKRYRMAYLPYLLYVVMEMTKIKSFRSDYRIKAYVSMTGLGAGVWAINNEKQTSLITDVIREILDEIKLDEYIDTIDFTYFATGSSTFVTGDSSTFVEKGKEFKTKYNGINIVFSQNAPSSKKEIAESSGLDELIIFEVYAGNRNAAPGNSIYVMGSRNNPEKDEHLLIRKFMKRPTGAQAAAFSSDIMLTQNGDINRILNKKYIILNSNITKSMEVTFDAAKRSKRRRVLLREGVRYLV